MLMRSAAAVREAMRRARFSYARCRDAPCENHRLIVARSSTTDFVSSSLLCYAIIPVAHRHRDHGYGEVCRAWGGRCKAKEV